MKKLLLSLLLLVGIGMAAGAQLSDVLTSDLFKNMSYKKAIDYTSTKTNATYTAKAYSNKGFQIRADRDGTGITVKAAPEGYVVEKIKVEFTTVGGGVDIYASNTAIDLSNLPSEKHASTKTADEIAIGTPYFAIAPATEAVCVVKQVTVTYISIQEANAEFQDVTVEVGMQADIVYTPEDLADITYTSADETIAKVEEGKVVGVAEGKTAITASWADGKYIAGEKTFNVTVTKARLDSEISFDIEHVDGKIGKEDVVGIVWQTAKVTAGDGVVTYSSSNPEIVNVNPETGAITPADIKGTGEIIITATISETENYREASAQYVAHIINPYATIEETGTIEFDFVHNDYGMIRNSSTTDVDYIKDPYSFTENTESASEPAEGIINITIEGAGNARLWDSNKEGENGLRFQKNCNKNVTFSVPENYVITKIAVIRTGGEGNFSGDGYNQEERVWTGESREVSLKFSNGTSVTTIQGFNVFYKYADSSLKPASLSFDAATRVSSAIVGKQTALNGAKNPNDLELTYKIAGLADTDYSIEKTEEGINVTVNKSGSYTLRAESEKNEEYMAGLAIMRLNVYPDVAPKFDPAITGSTIDIINGKVTASFEIPEGFTIYYNITETEADNTKSDNFYEYFSGENLEIAAVGSFSYYLKNVQNYDSDVVTYEVVKSEPAEIVGITHEVLAGKTVVRANYTLHVNNHREGNTYEVTFTVGGQTATNTEHTLVTEEEAAVAPVAEDFTSTHKLKGTVVVTGLTGETDYKASLAVKVNGEDTESHTTEFDVKTGTVGIEDVTADAAASAEYFTLQGVRVAQPEAGNIYIVRRGAEVSKELVK